MPSLGEVLHRHWKDYQRLYAASITAEQRAAVAAILRCHSAQCGGALYYCTHCQSRHFVPHGCGHRACGQCGHYHAQRWIRAQVQRLLPVHYFMVTFTVPEALRALFQAQPKIMIDALFAQSAGSLGDVAAQPKHLGGALGMIGVLHTWSRQLIYHPHIHYVVPAIALSAQGALKAPHQPDYLLPVEVLKARYRSRMRQCLQQQHPQIYAEVPCAVWRKKWNVNIQPVGRGQEALYYLGRYVYKTAISSTRILSHTGGKVRFSYKDSTTAEIKTCELNALEFIRRFLQHVLP
jgi:hypothetical protein